MTDLVLDNPKQDTLSATLSRSDPDWQLIPDIASSHWGTWLTVGLSVLGYPDPSFPPHNVRYETIVTPIEDPEIDTAVEFYPGGHESPVPSNDARDALRAQGYLLRDRPPITGVGYFVATTYFVSATYDGRNGIIATAPDFELFDIRVRGDGYDSTSRHGPSGGALVFGVDFAPLPSRLSFTTRLISGDNLESDWSPVLTMRNPEWSP